jgi:hypothetical protein
LPERNKGKLDEITLFQDEFDLKNLDFHLRWTFKTRTKEAMLAIEARLEPNHCPNGTS